MPRFLHTADWQIGRQFHTFEAEAAQALADARIGAVQRMARLATDHTVDAVLVAGDVFDAQTVSERTIRRLFNATQGFAGPWIVIPGNHDAALQESVWTHALRLGAVPTNVRLSLQAEAIEFPQAGFVVLTAPLTQRHSHHDLTEWFDRAPSAPGLARIGVAHGSVQGILAPGIESGNPIAPDRAASAQLDYLALGDWHGCKQIDARTWYSGTPEADRWRNNESGLCLLVEVVAGGDAPPAVTPLPVGRFRWLQSDHTIEVASDVERLVEHLGTLVEGDVVQLTVQGRCDLNDLARLQQEIARADAVAHVLRVELRALRLLPTDDDIAALHADGYLARVIQDLRERQQHAAEAEVATHAIGLLAGLLNERTQRGA